MFVKCGPIHCNEISMVEVTSNLFSSFYQLTSQPHPEPCTATVAALNLSLKFSKEPKSCLIASIKTPVLTSVL